MNAIRERLRVGTSASHSRLDASLIEYDLTTRAGLKAYLSVHFVARENLHRISTEPNERQSHARKLGELRDDLRVLGSAPPTVRLDDFAIRHPLGLSYVIAGSSLGSKLLYKQWLLSDDDVVGRAGQFLTSAKDSSDWVDFLKKTDTLCLSDSELDEVVASANTVFAVFENANNIIRLALDDH